MRKAVGALAILALVGSGCSELREPVGGERECDTTWRPVGASEEEGKTYVKPLVADRCVSCHGGGGAAAGDYSLETYLGALGNGTDTVPNAIAGDETSRILTALSPEALTQPGTQAHAQIQGLEEVRTVLADWVACEVSYFESAVHQNGILNPHDAEEFHGRLLENEFEWDFAVCAECHGADFTGGSAKSDCTVCHVNGPTACDTCHGLPPSSGAHPAHVNGDALDKPIACNECHVVPATWDAPNHIRVSVDGQLHADRGPAEVTFGALAKANGAPATWDADARSCTVYCHGSGYQDANSTFENPTWALSGDANKTDCTSCHGRPPSDHTWAFNQQCGSCHQLTVAADGTIHNQDKHLDGTVDVGRGSTQLCSNCHGSEQNPAPPADLAGNTTMVSLGVGAHQAHVTAYNGLTTPLSCNQCHPDVTSMDDPDHLDSVTPIAEVFPASIAATSLAFKDGAQPAWDRTTGTCTVYCHGTSAQLLQDTTPGLIRDPNWMTPGEAACGTCHGIPPRDHRHLASFTLDMCVNCHAETVDGFGRILFTETNGVRTTKHINGEFDYANP